MKVLFAIAILNMVRKQSYSMCKHHENHTLTMIAYLGLRKPALSGKRSSDMKHVSIYIYLLLFLHDI